MIKVGAVTFHKFDDSNKFLPTVGLREFVLNFGEVIESNGILFFRDAPLRREPKVTDRPYIPIEAYIGQKFILKCDNPKMKIKGSVINLRNQTDDILRPVVDLDFRCDKKDGF